MKSKITDLKYIGDGHLPDVPSRNLTKEEIIDNEYDYDGLVDSGLYIPPTRQSKQLKSKNKDGL